MACLDVSIGPTAAGTYASCLSTTRTVLPGLKVVAADLRSAAVCGSSRGPTMTTWADAWSHSSAAREYAPAKMPPIPSASPPPPGGRGAPLVPGGAFFVVPGGVGERLEEPARHAVARRAR